MFFFFLPPALLLYRGSETGDRNTLLLARNLSIASLVLTAELLTANSLSGHAPVLLGNILHSIPVVVSTPMICCGNWALSMFLWACLMISTIKFLKSV